MLLSRLWSDIQEDSNYINAMIKILTTRAAVVSFFFVGLILNQLEKELFKQFGAVIIRAFHALILQRTESS